MEIIGQVQETSEIIKTMPTELPGTTQESISGEQVISVTTLESKELDKEKNSDSVEQEEKDIVAVEQEEKVIPVLEEGEEIEIPVMESKKESNGDKLNESIMFYSSSDAEDSSEVESVESEAAPITFEPIKSKNETEPKVEPIHITIPNDSQLYPVGIMTQLVKAQIIVEQFESGEEKVLDLDSILVDEQKHIIGRISDTFGPVTQPFYAVRFNSEEEAKDQFQISKTAYFIPNFVKIVLTRPLKLLKGSDASNIHDEEIPEEEQEYSDDEKEIEGKRKKKGGQRSRKKPTTRPDSTPSRPIVQQSYQQAPRPAMPQQAPYQVMQQQVPRQVMQMPSQVPQVLGQNIQPSSIHSAQTLSLQYPFNPLDPLLQLQLQHLQMQQYQFQQLQQYNPHHSIQQLSSLLAHLQQQRSGHSQPTPQPHQPDQWQPPN
jgi:H/ACA ribonucleoprotein complex non-core subunit NAF1